mmetsp:Transcript_90659/g.234070  ORF Transcript_90659/g.234070 Transcript_90659/m.234070 type:complete len:504 (-) Transcript_90659:58-1569(-)
MGDEGLPPKTPSLHLHDSDYSWVDDVMPAAAKKDKLNIAIVSSPHSGHMLPLLHICGEVTKRGHRVRVITCDYGVKEFEKKVKQCGAEIVGLDTGGTSDEEVAAKAKALKTIIFLVLREMMLPPLAQVLAADPPDVVLADFASLAAADVAEEMGIPLVFNLPGPIALLRDFFGGADTATAWSFLGFHFARCRFNAMAFLMWSNLNRMRDFAYEFRQKVGNGHIVLVQTIWGLDEPAPVHPNVIVTGPVLPPPADLRQKLAKDHPDLYKFLHASGLGGVVYVTTGSLAQLHDWQVRDIYYGLKKADCRVVWSLKEKQQAFLPVKDDPSFFISPWTPQAELLQDDAVKAVITHCGWGGTLECMTAGKPVVTIPFFGDQPTNAKLLVESGAGEFIGRIPKGTEGDMNPYKEGWFTPDTVSSAVTKVLSNPSYKKATAKMMMASRASGGAEAAAQHVEWAARFGTGHLKSNDYMRMTGTNPFNGVIVSLVGLCAAAGLFAYSRALKK